VEALVSPAQGLWIVGIAIVFLVATLHFTSEKPKKITTYKMVSLGKRLDNGQPFWFKFGLGCHMLFAGQTGYGKSNELNYIISQLVGYPDVQFLIGNAKGGSDFLHWLPRASSVAVGAEATDDLVDLALAILRERYEALTPDVDISTPEGMAEAMRSERNVAISDDLPLIVLIVDEFIEYLKGKHVSVERATKLHTLLTTGRAVGIVVFLATQRPSQYSAPTDIREACPYHVSFRMDKYGTEMVFGKGSMSEVDLAGITVEGVGYGIVPKVVEPTPFIAPEAIDEECKRLAWTSARLRKDLGASRLIRDAI
jgi:hypothetical protein